MCLVTDAFEDLFYLESEQRGMPGLAHVIVPHPLGGLRPDVVRRKGMAVVDDFERALMEPS